MRRCSLYKSAISLGCNDNRIMRDSSGTKPAGYRFAKFCQLSSRAPETQPNDAFVRCQI